MHGMLHYVNIVTIILYAQRTMRHSKPSLSPTSCHHFLAHILIATSAPPEAMTGSSGWLSTAQTPSSPLFLCPDKSWIDVFLLRSHNLIEPSEEAVSMLFGLPGCIVSEVIADAWAMTVYVGAVEAGCER